MELELFKILTDDGRELYIGMPKGYLPEGFGSRHKHTTVKKYESLGDIPTNLKIYFPAGVPLEKEYLNSIIPEIIDKESNERKEELKKLLCL